MSALGHNRERQIKKLLEEDAWHVVRAAGSLGTYDLVALKDGHRPRVIECKATKAGPYAGFGPADRLAISRAAYAAGADAELAWWPSRGTLKWLPEDEWPK